VYTVCLPIDLGWIGNFNATGLQSWEIVTSLTSDIILEGFSMYRRFVLFTIAARIALTVFAATAQDVPTGGGRGGGTPEQRAAATRSFLGLGPAPDKAAAALGAPIYQKNCAFCHGPQARGASGPNLIVSDTVLGDDHGEHLIPFLKVGRPEKAMPAFKTLSDNELKDVSEFLHLQVEDVANRGTYQLQNIVVGDPDKGKAYVVANCTTCHKEGSFEHIASKFRTADQLQRGWVWPNRPADNSLAITATVKSTDGSMIAGQVTQISDFKITLIDSAGKTHVITRDPGADVRIRDPLAAHQKLINDLNNFDMHNVTAYLESLK
jgi:cytochrome c oxidase cbb3-type subunit 3